MLRAIGNVRKLRQQVAKLGQLVQTVARLIAIKQVEPKHQFFQSRISGAFTQPIAATVHTFCTCCHGGKLGRNAHAEVIVGVNFDGQAGHAFDPPHHVFDRLGRCTAHGVDNTDGVGRAFGHDRIAEVGQIIGSRARGVIGKEHGVQAAFLGIVDDVSAFLENILPGPAELRDQLWDSRWALR